ncbi:hypothetical protein [Natronobacterium texcoconense]|nr:hypothetical protein [Natronobacterium texcoconense]
MYPTRPVAIGLFFFGVILLTRVVFVGHAQTLFSLVQLLGGLFCFGAGLVGLSSAEECR